MIGKRFALLITGLCFATPVLAEDGPLPGHDEGRYTFNKVADGFVRLDMQTGDVSVCSQRTVGWACQAVPEDRAVLENEIARLRTENAALKKDILSRGLSLPSGMMSEPPAVGDADRMPHWHGHSDLDRMMAFVGHMWHRLVEAIARAQKQALDKS